MLRLLIPQHFPSSLGVISVATHEEHTDKENTVRPTPKALSTAIPNFPTVRFISDKHWEILYQELQSVIQEWEDKSVVSKSCTTRKQSPPGHEARSQCQIKYRRKMGFEVRHDSVSQACFDSRESGALVEKHMRKRSN